MFGLYTHQIQSRPVGARFVEGSHFIGSGVERGVKPGHRVPSSVQIVRHHVDPVKSSAITKFDLNRLIMKVICRSALIVHANCSTSRPWPTDTSQRLGSDSQGTALIPRISHHYDVFQNDEIHDEDDDDVEKDDYDYDDDNDDNKDDKDDIDDDDDGDVLQPQLYSA